MCGIVGVVAHTAVNQMLYDGLLLLQNFSNQFHPAEAVNFTQSTGFDFMIHPDLAIR